MFGGVNIHVDISQNKTTNNNDIKQNLNILNNDY